MLSMKDCLDYCDLTEEEIELIAELQRIPDFAAAQFACALVQTPEGVLILNHFMQELIDQAEQCGETERARRCRTIRERFSLNHPLPH